MIRIETFYTKISGIATQNVYVSIFRTPTGIP